MKTILLILFMGIVAMGCNHLEEGTVLRKHYEPAHSYISSMPLLVGKTTILVPYTVYDNEDFVLTVEGNYNGKIIHETVYVDEACYNSMTVGSHWRKTETCTFSDENNTKERN